MLKDKSDMKIVYEVSVCGEPKARKTLEYFDLDYDKLLFVEKHLVTDPESTIRNEAEVAYKAG